MSCLCLRDSLRAIKHWQWHWHFEDLCLSYSRTWISLQGGKLFCKNDSLNAPIPRATLCCQAMSTSSRCPQGAEVLSLFHPQVKLVRKIGNGICHGTPKVQPMLLYKEMWLQDAYDIDAFHGGDGIKIGIVHTLQWGYLPSLFAVPKRFQFQVASMLGTGYFLRASLLLKILAPSLS